MAKLVTAMKLCIAVELKMVFNLECCGEGGEAVAGGNVSSA